MRNMSQIYLKKQFFYEIKCNGEKYIYFLFHSANGLSY